MADLLVPQETVAFTVTKMPQRPADRKTIARLMRLQPHIVKGMKALQKQRKKHDNHTYIRAGVTWIHRHGRRTSRVEPGATFTLRLTPQIIPDLRSVEKFLDMKKAG